MADIINVMAAKVDNRMVLWERHPMHPAGEVFIYGNGQSVSVARTPQIDTLIESRKLVVLQGGPREPIEGYDQMTATVIVSAIAGMSDDTKAAVLEYETANKARKTVIEALTDGGNNNNS